MCLEAKEEERFLMARWGGGNRLLRQSREHVEMNSLTLVRFHIAQ